METLAWTLVTTACAVHLTRRHRHNPIELPRTIHRATPVLLLTGVLPLAALLPIDAPALVHAAADTNREGGRERELDP